MVRDGRIDIYKVLDEFVVYLDKSSKKASSIRVWVSTVKGYLRYLGIKIYSEDFKNIIRLPRIRRQREEPLTKEVLARLCRALPSKVQVAVLFAVASGVRIGELVQLKISDIDFISKPTRVRIRAEITKTKEARETYLTDEAAKALKDYLAKYFGWKENESNEVICAQVIFGRTSSIKIEEGYSPSQHGKGRKDSKSNPVFIAENVLASSLKWHTRKIPELNKINENGRRVIHFHGFRKFFRTVVGDAVGRDYAEALIGHHFYMDTYYNLPEEKKREMYLKAEPYLTISDFAKIEKDLNMITERQKEIEEEHFMLKQFLSKNYVEFPKSLEHYRRD